MTVYVVIYFYPDGSFAGVMTMKDSLAEAETFVQQQKLGPYNDCTFIISECGVDP